MQGGKVLYRGGVRRPGKAVVEAVLAAQVGFGDEARQTVALGREDTEKLGAGRVQDGLDGMYERDLEFGTVTLRGYDASMTKYQLLRGACTGLGGIDRVVAFRHAIRNVEILCV